MYREVIKAKNSGFVKYLEEEGESLEEFLPEAPKMRREVRVPYREIGWILVSLTVCGVCMYEWRVCLLLLLFASVRY